MRIATTFAVIVLVTVGGFGVSVHALLVLDHVDQKRSGADRQLQAAMQIYRRTGLLSFDARADAPSVPADLRAAVRRDGARATLVTGDSNRTVWAAGRVEDTVLSTRTSFPAVDPRVRTVDRTLFLAGGVTVALAILLGLWSASRLARRLRVAARTARTVAAGGDPRTLREAVGSRRDEVGDLADAVDAMAGQLHDRLRGEQRFTADVAHDLRTPVTGLVTAVALLDDSRPAALVRDRAAALARLVEDLLEVSRLDRGAEHVVPRTVDLGELVERVVRRGVSAGEYPDTAVRVEVERGSVTVETDPRRLERVLSNLVRNGLVHGAGPVELHQSGRRITVRDHGPGFGAELLAEGPQRFRRAPGATSSGQRARTGHRCGSG